MKKAILLIQCPDQKGLVAQVTNFLHERGGNIISLGEHVDEETKQFFMRIQWDLTEFEIEEKEKIRSVFKERIATPFGMDFKIYFSDHIPRMAVFVTRGSHCLNEILYRASSKSEDWDVEIPFVISNRESLRDNVEPFGIPYHHFPKTKEDKWEVEKQEIKFLEENNIDFIVLARYMQILSPEFTNHFKDRIINIHHSFLPAFIGPKPYHSAAKRGVKMIGATAHYVTSDLDAGPIISQGIHKITHKDTVKDMTRKGRDVEKLVLSEAIRLHLQRKILVHNNKTVIFD